IDAVLNHHRGERSSGYQRLSHDHMPPCRRHSIGADAKLDAMRVHRTIVTTTHIILACPDEFYRSAAQTFRNHSRLARYMGINHRAPAKAAAGVFRVKSDL